VNLPNLQALSQRRFACVQVRLTPVYSVIRGLSRDRSGPHFGSITSGLCRAFVAWISLVGCFVFAPKGELVRRLALPRRLHAPPHEARAPNRRNGLRPRQPSLAPPGASRPTSFLSAPVQAKRLPAVARRITRCPSAVRVVGERCGTRTGSLGGGGSQGDPGRVPPTMHHRSLISRTGDAASISSTQALRGLLEPRQVSVERPHFYL
jgi:hypothetical protein